MATMKNRTYYRRLVRNFKFGTVIIPVVVFLMWLATIVDLLFDMGWGWDRQIIWTAPIIGVGAVIVRLIGLAIFRAVGAIPPR